MDLVEDFVIDLNIMVGIWSRCDGMCRHPGRELMIYVDILVGVW